MAQRGVDLCVFFASPANSMPRVRVWPHPEAFDGAVDRDNAFVWTVRDLKDLNKINMVVRIVMSGHMRYSVAKEEISKQLRLVLIGTSVVSFPCVFCLPTWPSLANALFKASSCRTFSVQYVNSLLSQSNF